MRPAFHSWARLYLDLSVRDNTRLPATRALPPFCLHCLLRLCPLSMGHFFHGLDGWSTADSVHQPFRSTCYMSPGLLATRWATCCGGEPIAFLRAGTAGCSSLLQRHTRTCTHTHACTHMHAHTHACAHTKKKKKKQDTCFHMWHIWDGNEVMYNGVITT